MMAREVVAFEVTVTYTSYHTRTLTGHNVNHERHRRVEDRDGCVSD